MWSFFSVLLFKNTLFKAVIWTYLYVSLFQVLVAHFPSYLFFFPYTPILLPVGPSSPLHLSVIIINNVEIRFWAAVDHLFRRLLFSCWLFV